jgi:hypothetical protein
MSAESQERQLEFKQFLDGYVSVEIKRKKLK